MTTTSGTKTLLAAAAAIAALASIPAALPVQHGLPARSPAGLVATLKPPTVPASVARSAQVRAQLSRLPLRFEANQGQLPKGVRFGVQTTSYTAYVGSNRVSFALPARTTTTSATAGPIVPGEKPTPPPIRIGAIVNMDLVGANTDPMVVGQQRQSGVSNYLFGDAPAKWRTGVLGYGSVRYSNVYHGVDMVLRGVHGSMEYDFDVAPSTDPGAIELHFSGTSRPPSVDPSGAMILQSAAGQMKNLRPTVYQQINGTRRVIAGGYRLIGAGRVGFWIGAHDPRYPVVIDPRLVYSTYLGGDLGLVDGDGPGAAMGIAVDSSGSAYVTGYTTSPHFPTTANAAAQLYPGSDVSGVFSDVAYVTKLSPDGSSLAYSTYIGGTGQNNGSSASGDYGMGIAVNSAGNAFITGITSSSDFPTRDAFQASYKAGATNGGSSGFISQLTSDGEHLVYSSYLGGSCCDSANAIALDTSSNAFVTGNTFSGDFPTTPNAFQRYTGGDFADGTTILGSTTLSSTSANFAPADQGSRIIGTNIPEGTSIMAVDNATTITLSQGALGSGSNQFFSIYNRVGGHAFVTKVDSAGKLSYSTFVGGTSSSDYDQGLGIALDSSDDVYVAGSTTSTDFPVVAAIQSKLRGSGNNGIIFELNSSGSALIYSTYLGGSGGSDQAFGIAVDPASGSAFVTGYTNSLTDFPISGAAFESSCHTAPAPASGLCGFVTKIAPGGATLDYSSYLGGSGGEGYCNVGIFRYPGSSAAIAVNSVGNAFVTGCTESLDFPVIDPIDRGSNNMNAHAFLSEVNANGTSLIFSTTLGGGAADAGTAITVDAAGAVYMAGATASADFPTTAGAFQSTMPESYPGFVVKVDPTVSNAPVVTGLTPSTGSIRGGEPIQITGRNFEPGGVGTGTSVAFGGIAASNVSVNSDGSITAVAPAEPGGTGTVDVTVATAEGSSVANPVSRFYFGEGTWTATSSMSAARYGATVTLLPNGKVLVAGGETIAASGGATTVLASAELYNPISSSWSDTGPMQSARVGATATLLANGKVVVAGGSGSDGFTALASAEIYDPATGVWTATAGLDTCMPSSSCEARAGAAASLLGNGNVLVVGGSQNGVPSLASAEIYNPGSGSWMSTGPMATARSRFTATTLSNGQVLVAGGCCGTGPGSFGVSGVPLPSAELYNPQSGSWLPTGDLKTARFDHSATLLPNGQVLVAGGSDANGFGLTSTELYNPNDDSWTVSGNFTGRRYFQVASLLSTGQVLLAGGTQAAFSDITDSTELFAGPNLFIPSGHMTQRRGGPPLAFSQLQEPVSAVLLSSSATKFEADPAVCGAECGDVLIVGGSSTKTADLFTPFAQAIGPTISVLPASITFGSIAIGEASQSRAVYVTNAGNAPLTITSSDISGANGSEFTIGSDACSSNTLAPGESCTVQLVFKPTAAGLASATLTLASNDPAGTKTVALFGSTPPAAVVTIAPPGLEFMPQAVGTTSVAQTLTVNNTGNAPLDIMSLSLGGAQALEFSLSADHCSNTTVSPTESCTVAVSFAPTSGGPSLASATLSVSDNAAGSPQSVSLSGTATGGGTPPLGGSASTFVRLAGANRIATAIAVSQQAFAVGGSAKVVVLARDDMFPDALAGVPLAAAKGGPLLLSESSSLDPATKVEIQRVLPAGGTVYLLGGHTALEGSIDTTLAALGYQPVRESGGDRFATAVAIAGALGDPTHIFEVTGTNFPDAVSAGPAAISTGAAILLTNGAAQAAATFSYLSAHPGDQRVAVGGPAASADPGASGVGGPDRFATSAAVAARFFPMPKALGIATGLDFPDALSGGPLVGSAGGPVLLVQLGPPLPAAVASYLATDATGVSPGAMYVFGGTAVVGDGVAGAVESTSKPGGG